MFISQYTLWVGDGSKPSGVLTFSVANLNVLWTICVFTNCFKILYLIIIGFVQNNTDKYGKLY